MSRYLYCELTRAERRLTITSGIVALTPPQGRSLRFAVIQFATLCALLFIGIPKQLRYLLLRNPYHFLLMGRRRGGDSTRTGVNVIVIGSYNKFEQSFLHKTHQGEMTICGHHRV